jgi:hypothetical protein
MIPSNRHNTAPAQYNAPGSVALPEGEGKTRSRKTRKGVRRRSNHGGRGPVKGPSKRAAGMGSDAWKRLMTGQ